MNVLDVVLLLLLGYSVVVGLIKGFIKELLSLVGVVVSVLLALLLAPQLGLWLHRFMESETAAYAAGLIIVFVLTLLLIALISRAITKLMEFAHLGFMNRALGAVFGALRALTIGLILLVGLTLITDSDAPILADSKVAPFFVLGARAIAPLLPEGPRAVLQGRIDDLPETIILGR